MAKDNYSFTFVALIFITPCYVWHLKKVNLGYFYHSIIFVLTQVRIPKVTAGLTEFCVLLLNAKLSKTATVLIRVLK